MKKDRVRKRRRNDIIAAMLSRVFTGLILAIIAGLFLAPAISAQSPLPELRVEATDGGSVLHVKNIHGQALTAFLIELVDYPGSSFSLWQDDAAAEAIAPGAERAIPITNMTVGAVPEHVKIRAAVYEDGSTAGIREKAQQLVDRRHHTLRTVTKVVGILEQARLAKKSKSETIDELKAWRDGLPEATRRNRNSQETINNNATRSLLTEVAGLIQNQPLEQTLSLLEARQQALARSRPLPANASH